MDSIYMLWLIPIIILIWIVITMVDKKKEKKELEELQNTPIEVYRYTYKVYSNDGNNYTKLANAFCSIGFDEFIERILLNDTTLEINEELILNTENITKAELISKETKIIKPRVNRGYDSFYLSKGYSVEEVKEREVE